MYVWASYARVFVCVDLFVNHITFYILNRYVCISRYRSLPSIFNALDSYRNKHIISKYSFPNLMYVVLTLSA